jgi:hypothetical protein
VPDVSLGLSQRIICQRIIPCSQVNLVIQEISIEGLRYARVMMSESPSLSSGNTDEARRVKQATTGDMTEKVPCGEVGGRNL